MTFTNYGKQAVAWSLGSYIPNNFISYMAIGSGSGTSDITNTTLVNEWTRLAITGSPDYSVDRKVTFTADLNSVSASGLLLYEFGLLVSGPALIGSLWQRECVGSVVFDGTNELKIECALEVL